jgi:hypothetical protein
MLAVTYELTYSASVLITTVKNLQCKTLVYFKEDSNLGLRNFHSMTQNKQLKSFPTILNYKTFYRRNLLISQKLQQ